MNHFVWEVVWAVLLFGALINLLIFINWLLSKLLPERVYESLAAKAEKYFAKFEKKK